jgi:hypothetical protein
MELVELQNIWQEYDKKLSDNIHFNKEILRRMLISNPEKKLNWLKIKAGFSLVLPIVGILFILVPNIKYRDALDFYVGFFFFGFVTILTYYWSIRYYMLIGKIDFANPITLIKMNIKKLEKCKLSLTRLSYILMPFGIIGIFLMAKFPILSKNSLLPISLIIMVMGISIYYTFKYSIFERFRKLNMEIDEIEKLEKE